MSTKEEEATNSAQAPPPGYYPQAQPSQHSQMSQATQGQVNSQDILVKMSTKEEEATKSAQAPPPGYYPQAQPSQHSQMSQGQVNSQDILVKMSTKEEEATKSGQAPPPGYYPQAQPSQHSQMSQGQGYTYIQQPGQQSMMVVVAPPMENMPPDNMMFNVIVTIFCCWPIGIFAILKSMACRDAINRGDRNSAVELSASAKRLGYWTLGVGIAFIVLSIAAIVVIYAVWLIPMWGRLRYN